MGLAMTPAEFRAWRQAQGLSLSGAAKALGVSRRMIMLYDKGEKPDAAAPDGIAEITIPRAIALACAAIEAGLEPAGRK